MTKREKYLLLKLAEEAAEVAQAAIKYRLHDTEGTRAALEGELGDLSAITALLFRDGDLSSLAVNAATTRRITKEKHRGK